MTAVPPIAPGKQLRRSKRQKRFDELRLLRLPKATAFDEDVLFEEAEFLVATLTSIPGLIAPLLELTSAPPEIEHDPKLPRLPAPAVPHCSKTGKLPAHLADPEGRPRMSGSWALAMLHYVGCSRVAMKKWWKKTPEATWVDLFGFPHKPSYSETALRLGELERIERQRGAFHGAIRYLVQNARRHVPAIGEVIAYDGTSFVTRARLHHCCQDKDTCKAAGGYSPPIVKRASPDLIKEMKRAELDDPDFDPDKRPRGAINFQGIGKDGRAYFKLGGGHLYFSEDVQAGLRLYDGSGKPRSFFGGLGTVGDDWLTQGPMLADAIAADEQEYTPWPQYLEQITDIRGEAPRVVSYDGLHAISKVFEHNTRRGVATVAPGRQRGKMTREEWRTAAFDEHGIPRCKHCGGEGLLEGPDLGLKFDGKSGEPYLRSDPEPGTAARRH